MDRLGGLRQPHLGIRMLGSLFQPEGGVVDWRANFITFVLGDIWPYLLRIL
jgi:hypothetical protein